MAFAIAPSGDRESAIAVFEDALKICRESKRIDKGFLANTMAKYAGTLISAKRYPEAETLLLEAYPIVRDTFGPQHRRTQMTVGTIVKLYDMWGKPDKAAAMRATTQPASNPSSQRSAGPA